MPESTHKKRRSRKNLLLFEYRIADTSFMKTLIHNGHRIDAPGSTLTGLENVRYDGEVISRKWSILGANHEFEVTEHGEKVFYEVHIGTRWTGMASCRIYRNGELLFSDC